jgi:protein-tyrosine-phosphatase
VTDEINAIKFIAYYVDNIPASGLFFLIKSFANEQAKLPHSDELSQAHVLAWGCHMSKLRVRQLAGADFAHFDVILVMDEYS